MSKIRKEIFLENLPRWEDSRYFGKINWTASVGYKFNFIYDDIEDEVQIIDYINTKPPKITLKYKDYTHTVCISGIFDCGGFGVLLHKINSDYNYHCGERIIDDNRDITIIDRKKVNGLKQCKYHCNKCSAELWMLEGNIKKGRGCACCANKVVVENINSIFVTDKWMIPYIGEEIAKTHTKCSNEKIYPVCPFCHTKKDKPMTLNTLYQTHSIGCMCNDNKSFLSKYVYNVLSQLKRTNVDFDFKSEVSFEWNKYKSFDQVEHIARTDFVIYYKDRIIPIEADGGFHREYNSMSGQTAEESMYIDKQKDKNCLSFLNEEQIRITDVGDIKTNILNSRLNILFDLSCIDWNECFLYACSSLMVKACDIKKQHEDYTAPQIAKILDADTSTVINWLKRGTSMGLCNYNATEESKKSYQILLTIGRKKRECPILCLENNFVFKSISECSRQSKNVFGIEITRANIGAALKRNKTAKEYHFKKIEDLTQEEYEKYDIENKLKELEVDFA